MATIEKTFPLNLAQQRSLRTWDAEYLHTWVMPVAAPVWKPKGIADVRSCVDFLVRKYEALRSRLHHDADGGLVQQVVESGEAVRTLDCDVVEVSRPGDQGRLAAGLRAKQVRPEERAARCSLYLKDGDVVAVMLSVSHVFADGISQRILIRELTALVNGDPPDFEPPPQPAEYVQDPGSRLVRRNTDYWKGILGSAPRSCTYSGVRREPRERVEIAQTSLAAGLSERLAATCRALRVTPYALWVAAMSALVHLVADQPSQVFRSTYANRLSKRDASAVAQLAQAAYVPIAGEADDTLLSRTRNVLGVTLGTYRRSIYDANQLLDWLNRPAACRAVRFRPAFEINYVPPSFTDETGAPGYAPVGEIVVSEPEVRVYPETPRADLALLVSDGAQAAVRLTASRPVYAQRSASRLLEELARIVEIFSASPETPIAQIPVEAFASARECLRGHRSGAGVDVGATVALLMEFPGVERCSLTMREGDLIAHVQASGGVVGEDMLRVLQSRQPWFSGSVVPDDVIAI